MTANEIRQSFLDYFASHGHRIVSSAPLVPGDDATLLFTNAGMNQFKDLFLGKERRDYRRATTSQKCMRVSGKHNDLDNVGPSLRHHTFFEMLGNFSFGDYFKTDAIPFAWDLLTKVWALEPDRLYPTIFRGESGIARDDEAFAIWADLVPASRITELGMAENFWQMGEIGPCGRCSEIHYFRGHDIPCDQTVCQGVECTCQRYVEVWNNVFMEFERDEHGTFTPLPAPSIDTGMGLERITAVIQGKLSNYDTDLFSPILNAIATRAGRAYTAVADNPGHPDVSMRVVADHLRAMTFLIADGVLPSNEWRGYVLRKIMRRAMRHGKRLGFTEPVLCDLVDVVVAEMGGAYPELIAGREAVVQTVRAEEERFDAVLTSGLPRLEELLDRTAEANQSSVPGGDVFRLYDSLGVPFDFAEDLASQRGLSIDRPGYDAAMEAQRDRARASSAFKIKDLPLAFSVHPGTDGPLAEADTFVGYEQHEITTTVAAIFTTDGRGEDQLAAGTTGFVTLRDTPFYVEAGGQVSDTGTLTWQDGSASVEAVGRGALPARLHTVTVVAGTLHVGSTVKASLDVERRHATRRHHTATHLLHAALRHRLGSHVRQAGSLVSPNRLRFDFAHSQGLTAADRTAVESAVNAEIFRNSPVATVIKSQAEAIAAGAMALFGEKYGDQVRVVTIDDYSMELCGGTHVAATGEIGPFVITEESGVAAGVRRIEALAGAAAVSYVQERAAALDRVVEALGVPPSDATASIVKLQVEIKRLGRENAALKLKLALGGAGTAEDDDKVSIGNATFIARRVSGLDKDALRGLCDSLRDRIKRGVVVLVAEADGKVLLLVSVTKDLTAQVKAGSLVKELAPIIGGGGGGRPDFAEAGGRDATKIDELLKRAQELVRTLIKA